MTETPILDGSQNLKPIGRYRASKNSVGSLEIRSHGILADFCPVASATALMSLRSKNWNTGTHPSEDYRMFLPVESNPSQFPSPAVQTLEEEARVLRHRYIPLRVLTVHCGGHRALSRARFRPASAFDSSHNLSMPEYLRRVG